MKIKKHLKEHKEAYIAGGVCLVVGALGGAAFALHRNSAIVDIKQLRLWSPGDNNTFVVAALGDPGNVVRCIEDGSIYASQNAAAKALGANKATVSQHLAGKIADVKGRHLEKIGKAGHDLAS